MPLVASAPASTAQVGTREAFRNSHARGDARSRWKSLPDKVNFTSFVFSTLSKSKLFLLRFRFRSEISSHQVSQVTATEIRKLFFFLFCLLFESLEFGVKTTTKNTKNQRQRPAWITLWEVEVILKRERAYKHKQNKYSWSPYWSTPVRMPVARISQNPRLRALLADDNRERLAQQRDTRSSAPRTCKLHMRRQSLPHSAFSASSTMERESEWRLCSSRG